MYQQWRKSITTLAFVLASVVSAGTLAQAPKTPLALKPDAPDRYVVVSGDTLWSIAQRYTDSPWRWSELWSQNRDQIRNPNRIYPGNVIILDRARNQLALDGGTVTLSPQTRAESTARALIPSIPTNAIEPFLIRPLVIEPDGLDNAPTIIATEESRVVLEAGNRGFVRGMGDSKETQWYIYRRGPPLIDPDSNTTLGYEAIYLGSARVVRAGEPAIIVLTSVTREVGVGDKLVPAGRPEVPTYAPRPPAGEVRGRILSLYGGGTRPGEAGPLTVIAISIGRTQGIEPGNVVALYRSGATVPSTGEWPPNRSMIWLNRMNKDKVNDATLTLPDERYGLAFVFRVFDRVSYALVMSLSKPVNSLDVVQNP